MTNRKSSYVFEIAAVTTDPAKSALLANTLAESYVEDRLQVKFDATEAATGWLTERVAEAQTRGSKRARPRCRLSPPAPSWCRPRRWRR
ncbi:MAG: hypothetical protein R3D59_01170 [Paracoccaceae bacterium]